ncbi:unnamed protein product [Toxocara canis]|uniref:G-patch domain-containing protein n=1 Tax=Toxocara canis TaxID=6265 RepID=A0A183VCJ9_TOXCA|nr:unnamed protein product [Toxocara canis]
MRLFEVELSLSVVKILDAAYALIRNIPGSFHSKDLRRYFSDYVENGKFSCFHFRHRPEIQRTSSDLEVGTSEATSKQRCCCVVRFASAEERSTFINNYHMKFWSNSQGNDIPLRCFVFPLKVETASSGDDDILSLSDLRSLIELRPPALMPRGNVGTPSEHFLEQIRLCKLPPTVVGKLGIQSRHRLRKFGAVHLEYDSTKPSSSSSCTGARASRLHQGSGIKTQLYDEGIEDDRTRNLSSEEKAVARQEPDNDDGEDDDKDECEEWERHEAIYDDVTEQERTKPKKYEEEIEVTWEKGGPGLVWYTDTFYWNQIEQGDDCDWKWADDWDVDYSIYYDRADGTLDAKQAVEIRKDDKLRCGEITESCFKKKPVLLSRKRRASGSDADIGVVGGFEKHTKGIGSKLMRRFGWEPGRGLGRDNRGRISTLSIELDELGGTQLSGERRGVGYRGEKLQRSGFIKRAEHHISTIYDEREETKEKGPESVLRRGEPTIMKYR